MATKDYHYVEGTAYWAAVVAPNTTFEPQWKIDVCLDEKARQQVEAIEGISIKNKDDERGDFISLKRNVEDRNGNKKPAPKVIDSQNNPWDDKLIGNGSRVVVKFHTYPYNYRGKSGVSSELDAVQVIDLVEYGNADDGFKVRDGGYVVQRNEEAMASEF